MNVLVTGAAGPRGRQITAALHSFGHEVVGVDTEPWDELPEGFAFHRLDHRKRGFEELLRHAELDAIVHLAVHAGFRLAAAARHRLNLEGTTRVLELGRRHGIAMPQPTGSLDELCTDGQPTLAGRAHGGSARCGG